jgi:hypothetical protein
MNQNDGQAVKTMWCSDGSVSEVQVRVENGITLVSGDGEPWWASEPGILHETEAKARQAHVENEADGLEELADRHDRERVDAEVLAVRHMGDAEWNRAKAAELRARAKGLRDALGEFGR